MYDRYRYTLPFRILFDVNLFAVLSATIVSLVVGFVWYSFLFGKQWMSLTGVTEAHSGGMMEKTAKTFIKNFIGLFILVVIFNAAQIQNTSGAIMMVFWLWLGFSVPSYLGTTIWEERPAKLAFIDLFGFYFSFAIASVVIVKWPF
jgi:hypothetical protein